MKNLRTFEIDIVALKSGLHSFTFHLDNSFFAYFKEHQNGFIEKGNCNAEVILEKNEHLIRATFSINGTVELVCDRSLDEFDYEVEVEEIILYKYSEEERELTEEIILITRRTPNINVGEFLYEFLMLDIPMKKLHPRFWEEDEYLDEYLDDDSNDDSNEYSDQYTENNELDYLEDEDFEQETDSKSDEDADQKTKKINFIYSSDSSKEEDNKTDSSSEEEKIDPRWNILKNLKNNQN